MSLRQSALSAKDVEALALANAGHYSEKQAFYQVKDLILERFAKPDGYDLQLLEDLCWSCEGRGCSRCAGGSWNSRKWYLLRFNLNGRIFHKPVAFLPSQYDREKDLKETIKVRIKHAPVDSRQAQRSAFRLMRKYHPSLWRQIHKNWISKKLTSWRIQLKWAWHGWMSKMFRRKSDSDIPF